MRIEKKFTIIGLSIIVIIISMIIGISFALPEDITSSEYIIKNNTIYAVPTTYNFRVEELVSKLNSEDDITIYNKTNEELNYGDKVISGSTLVSNNSTYNIVVLGDVLNDGTINLGDISKLYNAYKGKTSLSDIESLSGDITKDNTINLADVSKLYNYFKGKSAFSYYNQDMIDVDNIINKAYSYYNQNNYSSKLGKNVSNELDVNYSNDQILITKDGEVELAIRKSNKCYRKSTLSDYIDVVDEEYCDADITKFASNNGRLHVSGSKLMNEYNEEFRLVGASGSGSSSLMKSTEHSKTAFATLKKWGANIIRIWIIGKPSYPGDFYFIGNEDEYMKTVYEAIDNAIANDLYVDLVWGPGDENDNPLTSNAIDAFTKVATKYPNDCHILYELWNEPHGNTTWSDIKEFSNQVIPAIRSISPDSIIISGTTNYDKNVSEVIDDKLNYNNIMYAFHMYMSSMTNVNINYLKNAVNANIPIFVTEWAGTDASSSSVGSYLNDAHAYSFLRYLNYNNISHIGFCFHSTDWVYGFIGKGNWDETLPDSVLKKNGLFFKNVFLGKYETDKYLMTEVQDDSYYKSSEYKDKIKTVSFKNRIDIPSDALISWDLSATGDNTVIGYLTPSLIDDNMYDLTISANGYVNLPRNSGSLFKGLINVESYDFTNVKTDLVTNLSYAFLNNKKIKTIDLSNFDASRITFMYSTFGNDEELESINFKNWNPKLEGMTFIFSGCKKLKTLDLSGFNVEHVSNFSGIFLNANSLTDLNISTWKPMNVTNLNNSFAGLTNINEIDLSGFTKFSEDVNIEGIFENINSNALIKTGNEEFKNRLISEYPNYIFQ